MKRGQTIGIAIVVLCVCASIIVGALYAAGVIGGSPSSSGSLSPSSPSKAPAPSPSRTPAPAPARSPSAYSGPSYAPVTPPPPPPPPPPPSSSDSTSTSDPYATGLWDSTGCTFPDSRAKKSDAQTKLSYCKNWCKDREADPCCAGLGMDSSTLPSLLQGMCVECGGGANRRSDGMCNCPPQYPLNITTMTCKCVPDGQPDPSGGQGPGCCSGRGIDDQGNCRSSSSCLQQGANLVNGATCCPGLTRDDTGVCNPPCVPVGEATTTERPYCCSGLFNGAVLGGVCSAPSGGGDTSTLDYGFGNSSYAVADF